MCAADGCMGDKVAKKGIREGKTGRTVVWRGLSPVTIASIFLGIDCRATLLNIGYRQRCQNLQDVAYLPDLTPPVEVGQNAPWWRRVKLVFISKCLAHLLAPMKAASSQGKPRASPAAAAHQCTACSV